MKGTGEMQSIRLQSRADQNRRVPVNIARLECATVGLVFVYFPDLPVYEPCCGQPPKTDFKQLEEH